jgi:hypothetical protein
LASDPSIQHLSAQFVSIKINTEDDAWATWLAKYPHEGEDTPIVYIIRADGEKLYGVAAEISGEDLPKLLMTPVPVTNTLMVFLLISAALQSVA